MPQVYIVANFEFRYRVFTNVSYITESVIYGIGIYKFAASSEFVNLTIDSSHLSFSRFHCLLFSKVLIKAL
jgi:hypothetical protein